MASTAIQMLASVLCLVGWAGTILCCILPMWKVTAFVGTSIVTSQRVMEGIWMTCITQSSEGSHCPCDSYRRCRLHSGLCWGKVHIAFWITEEGGKKEKVAIAAGGVLLASGLFCLIPTSWTAGVIVKRFYNPSLANQPRELGACLYIGWASSILLFIGGCLLINSACSLKSHKADKSPSVHYLVARSNGSTHPGSGYIRVPSASHHPASVMTSKPQSNRDKSTSPPPYTNSPFNPLPKVEMTEESERSWAPPSAEPEKRPESPISELSEALTTKSQLKKREMLDSSSVSGENEDATVDGAKTYL
ncbi:Claudin-like protein ZF-A89 [Oryzias melastigma]|uniref:Claudin-like protein ZF-A89 n=1 Tax=Oryzias melastigma TaxID=30732 RepID=A0A834BQW9_ORYME|nr:Claudin-like protein ZF-A89 [Oryzias melastigma]